MLHDKAMKRTESRKGATVDFGVIECQSESFFQCSDDGNDRHGIEFREGSEQRSVIGERVRA